MDIPLDEVIYFDAITSSSTGAATDADSTPTFAVYEEATDTDIGVGGNMTKRTSLTGDYRGTFTLSAANGFEVGKWYNVIGSATVGGVAGKAVLKNFRVVAAEVVAGYPVADTEKIGGQTASASGTVTFPNATLASTTNITAAAGCAVSSIGTDVMTAAAAATDFIQEIRNAVTGYAGAMNLDASGNVKVSDGTGANQIDTLNGGIAHVILCDTTTTNTDMLTAAGVWAAATRILTAGTNIALAKGTGVTGFNDLSAAQVNAEADTALSDIKLDKLISAAESGDVANSSIIAKLASKSATPAFSSYDNTTDSLEANRDNIGTAGAGLTAADDATLTAIAALNNITAASVWAVGTRTLSALGFTLGASDLATGILTSAKFAAGAIDAASTSADFLTEIRNAITGYAGALDTDANGRIRIVDGTAAGEIDTVSGGIAHVVLCDTTTTNSDMLTAVGVWAAATRVLTAGTNIALAKGTGVTGFNDLSAAQVNAEVVDALATDTYAEPGQGTPASTISLSSKLSYLYKAWLNKNTQTDSQQSLYNAAGGVVDQKRTVSSDGTTTTIGTAVTGP